MHDDLDECFWMEETKCCWIVDLCVEIWISKHEIVGGLRYGDGARNCLNRWERLTCEFFVIKGRSSISTDCKHWYCERRYLTEPRVEPELLLSGSAI